MLQFDDNEVIIHLKGAARADIGLLWAGLLLLLAIAVAGIAATMPSGYAIAAIFILAVACFGFNYYRQQQKNKPISQGILKASAYVLNVNGQIIAISSNAHIDIVDDKLVIQDKKTWVITGFENPKEMQVLQAVLLGRSVGRRQATIKMQEN